MNNENDTQEIVVALLCLLLKLNLSLTVWVKTAGWCQRVRESPQIQRFTGLQRLPAGSSDLVCDTGAFTVILCC